MEFGFLYGVVRVLSGGLSGDYIRCVGQDSVVNTCTFKSRGSLDEELIRYLFEGKVTVKKNVIVYGEMIVK